MINGFIETLAFGGSGILRDQHQVIFVPFTAPGDHVTIEITEQKKRYAKGKLIHLHTEGPSRVTPVCPHYGICGGCQLQHLNIQAQAAAKTRFIQDAFRGLQSYQTIDIPPVLPSQTPFGYRQHISLKLHRASTLQIGYTQMNSKIGNLAKPAPQILDSEAASKQLNLNKLGDADGLKFADVRRGQKPILEFICEYINDHTFVPIQQCPLFHAPNDPVFQPLLNWLKQPVWDPITSGHLRLMKHVLVFQLNTLPEGLIASANDMLTHWRGIIFSTPNEVIHIGNTKCQWEIPSLDLSIQFSPFGFVQNHAEESIRLYQHILNQIPTTTRSATDLYCGVGITTLLLARRNIPTLGIESHADTVELAKANALHNQLPLATFQTSKAESISPRHLKDLVLLNPPRIGLHPHLIQKLIQAKPTHLIYTSCMPPTLTRDLLPLLKAGYQIQSVQGFDLFPQTTHVETVVTLQKLQPPQSVE